MLTKKKRLYAEARESELNQKDSAIAAGCPEKTAKAAGCRYEKDPDIIKYREKLKAKESEPVENNEVDVSHQLANTVDPSMSNVDAATLILRAQLHDDDERIAQGAAKILLDWEHKKQTPLGKKDQKQRKADDAAKGKFKPRLVN